MTALRRASGVMWRSKSRPLDFFHEVAKPAEVTELVRFRFSTTGVERNVVNSETSSQGRTPPCSPRNPNWKGPNSAWGS